MAIAYMAINESDSGIYYLFKFIIQRRHNISGIILDYSHELLKAMLNVMEVIFGCQEFRLFRLCDFTIKLQKIMIEPKSHVF